MEARDQKLGGLANQVTDAEAKKKGISVYRAAKHPTLKGGIEVDFVSKKEASKDTLSTPNSARSRQASARGRPSTASTKGTPQRAIGSGLKRPTTASASSKKEMNNDEALIAREDLSGVDDPIALSI